jgi:hypothetical protein
LALDFNKQYQMLLILWFALLMSVGLYLLMSFLAAPPLRTEARTPTESLIALGLTMFGAVLVLVSFLVKKKFFQRAIEQQDPSFVQKGIVLACALCEAAALLGLLERFAFARPEYFWLFLIGGAGILLHFPTRNKLEAASHQNENKGF